MIRIFDNLEDISRAAAEIFVEAAREAAAARGFFSVALSGGNTPRRLHELLAFEPFCDQIPWRKVHIFWGDERCVLPDDPRSNYRMARETLLERVALPPENIHPMRGDLPPAQAAARYAAELQQFFDPASPIFDLILLGLGDNAHTASLFPHTPVLAESTRWVADVTIPELGMSRITLTAPLINQARQVVFLVSGAAKAHALRMVLEGAYQPLEYPAQLIHPSGARLRWLVDKAAGSQLTVSQDLEGKK